MNNFSIDSIKIGARIRKLRKKQGKTQSYYADLLYISPSYLALIESGKRVPSIEVLIQIAKTCDVTIDYLIFGDERTTYDPQDYIQLMFRRLCDTYSSKQIEKALLLAEYYLLLEDEKQNYTPSD